MSAIELEIYEAVVATFSEKYIGTDAYYITYTSFL
jgi:hypothetical protein